MSSAYRQASRYVRKELSGNLKRYVPITIENRIIDRSYEMLGETQLLAATKNGLYLIRSDAVIRLLRGQFYGITRLASKWFVFERLSSTNGRIIEFRVTERGIGKAKQRRGDLDPGCHQIDMIHGGLLVADTYNNRLISYDPSSNKLDELSRSYPPGSLNEGRNSPNYAHLNSIWSDGIHTLAMFHNESTKTGRCSEIASLNDDFQVVKRISTTAGHAHNIMLYQDEFLYCDSKAGTLVHGDREVHRCHYLTRGLSVTPDRIFVGHSQYGKREDRESLKGGIAVLDGEFCDLGTIPLPGMVQEIRAVNTIDLGLSYYATKERLRRPLLNCPNCNLAFAESAVAS
ncbi:hypothetical protein [Stieleria maiorica]|uniref:hypothetical protein n=1 Tax=Stieleria maiorica TaxID=2795974 RepID=UPI0011C97CE5|nr:hypothetical protein [Stieleria maiorica]